MWISATECYCQRLKAGDYGWWLNSENDVRPKWFEGDPIPLNVGDIIEDENSKEKLDNSENDKTDCVCFSDDE